ncbi:MAG: twin-arginine translocase TatA/TatE family subunit [Muribaculaceae bacterium]
MLAFILCMIGTTEIILIGALALLLFGGKKIPELMKGLGQGVRSFKQGMNEPVEPAKPTVDTEVKLPDETQPAETAQK